jgi:hypothetical protein
MVFEELKEYLSNEVYEKFKAVNSPWAFISGRFMSDEHYKSKCYKHLNLHIRPEDSNNFVRIIKEENRDICALAIAEDESMPRIVRTYRRKQHRIRFDLFIAKIFGVNRFLNTA